LDKIELSIIIVNWNVKEYLIKCIKSILQKIENIKYEIIVVDNASTDGSIQELKKSVTFKNIITIENDINKGFAAANNQGYDIARGEIILFLNPDTFFLDNNLKEIINELKKSVKIGVATCKVLNHDMSIQKTCARHFPNIRRKVYDELLFSNYISFFEGKGEYYKDKYYKKSMYVECISGCFMLIKKVVLEKTGAFDERYFMYGEDIEICSRIKKMGFEIIFCPEMSILHFGGKSSKKSKISYFNTTKRLESDYILIKKICGNADANAYRLIIIIGSVIRILGAFIAWKCMKKEMYQIIEKHKYCLKWGLGLLPLKN
jgi:O-antigen biosynthesis protein